MEGDAGCFLKYARKRDEIGWGVVSYGWVRVVLFEGM